jgi:GNAT superfamily N-acetyltransferase
MAVSVRTADVSDAGEIARLTAQLGYEISDATAAERLGRFVRGAGHRFLVAEFDGRVAGWAHAIVWESLETGPFVLIGGLVVDRPLRRRGVGAALMGEVEAWAIAQGCTVVRLWSSVARAEAHQFYERLGYANIKSQYSFVKSVGAGGTDDFSRFVPRLT